MAALTSKDIKRLATMAGIGSFECWKFQMTNAEDRICRDMAGDFQSAFARCLPIWVETGRVRDLSRGIRTPTYLPHYSKFLGDEFARKFKHKHANLIALLDRFIPESCEYLCLCDLLEAIMYEFWANEDDVPSSIFLIQSAVPEVIQYEFANDKRFADCMTNLGHFFKCLYSYDYEY